MPEVIGLNVRNQSGKKHLGVMQLTISILKGTKKS